jgi:hypothetical protein
MAFSVVHLGPILRMLIVRMNTDAKHNIGEENRFPGPRDRDTWCTPERLETVRHGHILG